MSTPAAETPQPQPVRQGVARQLFAYEARKDGRVVVFLRGVGIENGGVTVEAQIFAMSSGLDTPPYARPFTFSSREQATRFIDETLLVLEYLACSIAE